MAEETEDCKVCDGVGHVWSDSNPANSYPCGPCDGTGKVKKK